MNKLIGPHEGQELELLRSGKKMVALFSETIPEEYEVAKTEAQFDFIEFAKPSFVESNPDIPYAIIFVKSYRQSAVELYQLLHTKFPAGSDDFYNKERKIGSILGYSKEAIEAFIQNLKKRRPETLKILRELQTAKASQNE